MLISLVKKDILISKKYAVLSLAVIIFMPLLVSYTQPAMRGATSLILTVFMESVMFQLALSETEIKYPRATVFLCATPYTRKKIVQARYLLHTLVFLCCCVVYMIEGLFISFVAAVSVHDILLCFFVLVLTMGIYIPVSFKFGYEKTKFFLIIFYFALIMVISIFSTFAFRIMERIAAFSFFSGVMENPLLQNVLLFIIGVALWLLSMMISIRLYNNKDLG